MAEIEGRLESMGNAPPTRRFTYEPEMMKVALEEMCGKWKSRSACTRVVGAIRDERNLRRW